MLHWIDWQQRAGFTDATVHQLTLEIDPDNEGIAPRTLRRLRSGETPSLRTVFLLVAVSRRHPIPGRDPRHRKRSIDIELFDRWGVLNGG